MRRICWFLAALSLTGCDLRSKILHVGDSNMVTMAPALINSQFMDADAQHLPTFAAVVGAALSNIADWEDILGQIGGGYDASVVHLGLNDCAGSYDLTGYADEIDRLMAALPDGPVIFLDVPYTTASNYSTTCEVAVNTEWQAAFYRHSPRIVYLNANAIVSSLTNSQRFVDGLHWSPAAQALLVEAIRTELDARF